MAIQKLEDELGAPLFERGKSEVTVTPVGERIVEQAQRVLEEAARIRRSRRPGATSSSGRCELGVIYTVAPYLLPDLIPALHERAPQMPLEHRGEPDREPRGRAQDAAASTRRSSRCRSRRRASSPSSCTRSRSRSSCRSDHKWAKRKSVQPDELAGEHTILLNVGHCFRDQVLDAARSSIAPTRA